MTMVMAKRLANTTCMSRDCRGRSRSRGIRGGLNRWRILMHRHVHVCRWHLDRVHHPGRRWRRDIAIWRHVMWNPRWIRIGGSARNSSRILTEVRAVTRIRGWVRRGRSPTCLSFILVQCPNLVLLVPCQG